MKFLPWMLLYISALRQGVPYMSDSHIPYIRQWSMVLQCRVIIKTTNLIVVHIGGVVVEMGSKWNFFLINLLMGFIM